MTYRRLPKLHIEGGDFQLICAGLRRMRVTANGRDVARCTFVFSPPVHLRQTGDCLEGMVQYGFTKLRAVKYGYARSDPVTVESTGGLVAILSAEDANV